MRGRVILGSKNLFTLELDDGRTIQARIKGKVLAGIKGHYNSLAPGDLVEAEIDSRDDSKGLVLSVSHRGKAFARFNEKGQAPQVLAANVDRVLLVTSPDKPPFRPRFIDRVLVSCADQGIPLALVVNKVDEGISGDVERRLSGYARSGLPVLLASAKTGEGIAELRQILREGISVMTGQSGVGKSSLLNALQPGLALKIGELCSKFDRGSHTTVLSVLLKLDACPGMVVDTPGFRRFALRGMGEDRLVDLMPDIAAHARRCAFGASCSHIDEEGCALQAAAESGEIDPDRLDSFFRMREELLVSNELTLRSQRESRPRGKARPRVRITNRDPNESLEDD